MVAYRKSASWLPPKWVKSNVWRKREIGANVILKKVFSQTSFEPSLKSIVSAAIAYAYDIAYQGSILIMTIHMFKKARASPEACVTPALPLTYLFTFTSFKVLI